MRQFFDDPYVSGVLGNFIADALKRLAARMRAARPSAPELLGYGRDQVSAAVEMDVAGQLALRADELLSATGDPGEAGARFVRLAASHEFATYVDQIVARTVLNVPSAEADTALAAALDQLLRHYGCADLGVTGAALLEAVRQRAATAARDLSVGDPDVTRYWQKAVLFSLDQLRRSVDSLAALDAMGLTATDLESFAQQLAARVHSRSGFISLSMIGERRSLPIDQFYVEPSFTVVRRIAEPGPAAEPTGPDWVRPQWSRAASLVDIRDRTVVLGEPGNGKSTLTKKICFDRTRPDAADRGPVPVPVVLRELARRRSHSPMNVSEYLIEMLRSDYELRLTSAPLVEHLLLAGAVHVVFDGLDEITDPAEYEAIVVAIGSFCLEYKSVPVTVTSRPHGFDADQFADFAVFSLSPFNSAQVQEYVGKWFALDRSTTKAEQDQFAADFMAGSADAGDLRSVPLLLTLMCSVYNTIGSIPKSRSEVYERCAELYFRDWDARRNIRADDRLGALPASLLFDGFGAIAEAVLADDDLAAVGVTAGQLTQILIQCFVDSRMLATGEEKPLARAFAEFATGRAWLLQPAGRDADNRVLYQFSHRTFLEYFAAEHRVRHSPDPAELARFVVAAAADRSRLVVAELCLQIAAAQRPAQVRDVAAEMLRIGRALPLGRCDTLAGYFIQLMDAVPLDRDSITGMVRFVLDVVVGFGEAGLEVATDNGYAMEEMNDEFVYRSLGQASGLDVDFAPETWGRLLRVNTVSFTVLRDAVSESLRRLAEQHPYAACSLGMTAHRTFLSGTGGAAVTRDDPRYRRWLPTWLEWSGEYQPLIERLAVDAGLAVLATGAQPDRYRLAPMLRAHGWIVLVASHFNPFFAEESPLAAEIVHPVVTTEEWKPSPTTTREMLARQMYQLWATWDGHDLGPVPQAKPLPQWVLGSDKQKRRLSNVGQQEEAGAVLTILLAARASEEFAADLADPAKSLQGVHLRPYAEFAAAWQRGAGLDGPAATLPVDDHIRRVLVRAAGAIRRLPVLDPEPPRRSARGVGVASYLTAPPDACGQAPEPEPAAPAGSPSGDTMRAAALWARTSVRRQLRRRLQGGDQEPG